MPEPDVDAMRRRDALEVVAANDTFYRAFEALDLKAMERVWAQREEDVCIHPGWEILTGWATIRRSWDAIFQNAGKMRLRPTDVAVEVSGDFARLSCVEHIVAYARGQEVRNRVACTNLFVRTAAGWRLTAHHSSPIADRGEPARPASRRNDLN